MTITTPSPLTEEEQREKRAWFRERWEHGVVFNREVGMRVLRWEPDSVEMTLPYTDLLSSHEGIFHGGVISALIDTAGGGSVMAGHDFTKGSRMSTVTISVQYLKPARGPEVVARARCVRRGRRLHFAEVEVHGVDGAVYARGQVTVSVEGERPGVGEPHPRLIQERE
jgi:uncharacterized protein (TIGR00369 family)